MGDRSRRTLKRLYQRVQEKFKPDYYATDGYGPYFEEIPEEQHANGKDLTYTIEQHNSDTRHWAARFRRKSKVVTHCALMAKLTVIAVEYVHKCGGIEELLHEAMLYS